MSKNEIPLEVLAKDSPADMAAKEIRKLILSGKIAPGTRISSERDLAKFLGVKRNTVRNGLIQLEKEGLIRPDGRGRSVSENAMIAGSRKTRSNSIAVLMNEMIPASALLKMTPSGWSTSISTGVMSEAFASGITTMIVPSGKIGSVNLGTMFPGSPGAVIIIDQANGLSTREEIQRALNIDKTPVVVYGDDRDCPGCDMVCSDHRQGSMDLTSWVISRGASHILRVEDIRADMPKWAALRRTGFEEACRKAGIATLPVLEVAPTPSYDFSKAAFEADAHKMAGYLFNRLDGNEKIDAIMALSDGHIPKIVAALKILGRDPGKIPITGYDNYWNDLPERKWEDSRPVATVDKDNLRIGQELVRLVMGRFSGKTDGPPQKVMVPQRLIVNL